MVHGRVLLHARGGADPVLLRDHRRLDLPVRVEIVRARARFRLAGRGRVVPRQRVVQRLAVVRPDACLHARVGGDLLAGLDLASFDYGHLYTLQRVRDIFCFCSFTGLRFSDASALRWQDIDGSTLRLVTQKTADRLTIPLNTHALAILDAYRTLQSPTPLPRISNQKANQYLKDAALLAGLDRETTQTFYRGAERHEERLAVFEAITTHWARRTFVVHALRLGIPAEVVMRFTGHSNYDAMRPYIDIVEEAKRDYMSRFDFGNSVGKTSAKE